MNEQTDSQLLRAYAEQRSERAFAELVRRHIDLVHSAALRMVCDTHQAQDVTQAVFIALAKNAAQLTNRPILSGWLHRTAQNIAAQTVRTDVRRRAREQEAAVMNELLSATPDVSWDQIAPHLDAALGELDESERDALLFRYFERKSAREMAAQLGISDEAAQKRVSRAVERLREFFAKRGVTVGASGLAIVISANAVQAAPVGLALTISTAAALTGTTLAATTVTAAKAVTMTALQKTVVTATIAVLAGVGIYEARQAAKLRAQVQTLQQRQAPMEEESHKLQDERDEAARQIAVLREDNERLNQNTSELLKLRGQVGLLRKESDELKRLREANPQFAYSMRATSSNAQNSAKSQTVSMIVVKRIQQPATISEELIRTYISVAVGETLDRTKIDRDVQNLYDTGLFYNVRVAEAKSDAGITLTYLVQERPRLTAINFAGNTKFRGSDLTSLLTSRIGKSLDERALFNDAGTIQAAYTNSGYADAKVRYSTKVNESLGEGEVTFEITE